MKKSIAVLAALLTAGSLMAGSVDYLSNQSADYLRTFSRNASLDADAAVYNPAGTVFMTPGWTFGLSNQSIFKLYENELNYPNAPASYNKDFKSTEPTLFLPNAQVVWNTGVWSAYLATGVVAGGGTAVYSDGVPVMPLKASGVKDSIQAKLTAAGSSTTLSTALWKGGNLTATSLYPQLTLGGAYAFNEAVSVSLALRGVYAYQSFVGKSTYDVYKSDNTYYTTTVLEADATKTAFGLGGVIGADWKALPGLLLTTRIETPTSLAFKTTVNSTGKDFGGTFKDGDVTNRDLPGLIALGARYDWEAFSFTASGTLFLLGLSASDGYNNKMITPNQNGYSSVGWETGASVEYSIIPETLRASVGGMLTTVGGNGKTYNDFDFSLDSQSVGGGLVYAPIKDLDVTLALSKTFYTSASGSELPTKYVTYRKDAFTIDIGAQYKLY